MTIRFGPLPDGMLVVLISDAVSWADAMFMAAIGDAVAFVVNPSVLRHECLRVVLACEIEEWWRNTRWRGIEFGGDWE